MILMQMLTAGKLQSALGSSVGWTAAARTVWRFQPSVFLRAAVNGRAG